MYATAQPIHALRPDIPEVLETTVAKALQKDPTKRYRNGLELAADLTRVHQKLRDGSSKLDSQEQFSILRTLKFFHDFSHSEILEVLRASTWQDYEEGEEIVKEGEMDDRFYVIVQGSVAVMRNTKAVGQLDAGDCFGETSYVRGAKRLATIKALAAGDADEGQLHAARAVLRRLPAALQQSLPAQPDQPSAESVLTLAEFALELGCLPHRSAQLSDFLIPFDQRVGRVIVDGLEVLRFDHVRAHALFLVQPHGDVAHDVLDELRVVVGALGHVLLVGALEDAVDLARGFGLGDVDQLLEPHVAFDARLDRDVRALVVRAASEMRFEHGHRLVAATTTLSHSSGLPPWNSPISDAL